jgi:predicted Zn-dependent protease
MKKSLFFIMLLSSFLLVTCGDDDDKDNNINIFSIEDDKQLGLQVSAEIEADPSTYPVLSETQYPEAYTHLRRIRDEILSSGKVAYADDFNWECKIINDDVLNAFCAPGGYIYVYTGIIDYLDNEAQFAGVLGHEIAHAARRHSTDQLTKVYGLSVMLNVLLGNDPWLIADIAANLLVLQFSRNNEYEADEYSVIYLYETEYDPTGCAGFFEKLQEGEQGGLNIPFLSTHPSDDKRIERINDKWQELGGKTGGTFVQRYNEFKASLP